MTYSSLASRLRGRQFFCSFLEKQAAFLLVFKNGGSPPPRFSQIGGLPLYTKQFFTNIIKTVNIGRLLDLEEGEERI